MCRVACRQTEVTKCSASQSVSKWSPHTLRYTHGACSHGRKKSLGGSARCGAVRCGVVWCLVVHSSMRQQIQCPTTPEKDHVNISPFSHHAPSVDHSASLSLSLALALSLTTATLAASHRHRKRSIGTLPGGSVVAFAASGREHSRRSPARHTTRRSSGRAVSKSASRSLSPCMVAGRDSKTGQSDTEVWHKISLRVMAPGQPHAQPYPSMRCQ